MWTTSAQGLGTIYCKYMPTLHILLAVLLRTSWNTPCRSQHFLSLTLHSVAHDLKFLSLK